MFGKEPLNLTEGEMPSHYHNAGSYDGWKIENTGVSPNSSGIQAIYPNTNSAGSTIHIKTQNTGSSQSHNNMQPYLVVFVWKRTA